MRTREHQVLDGDQRQRAILLRFVNEDRRLAEVRVCARAVHAWRGRARRRQPIFMSGIFGYCPRSSDTKVLLPAGYQLGWRACLVA
jgi:hypothetical protein